jgi:hypothetical protein
MLSTTIRWTCIASKTGFSYVFPYQLSFLRLRSKSVMGSQQWSQKERVSATYVWILRKVFWQNIDECDLQQSQVVKGYACNWISLSVAMWNVLAKHNHLLRLSDCKRTCSVTLCTRNKWIFSKMLLVVKAWACACPDKETVDNNCYSCILVCTSTSSICALSIIYQAYVAVAYTIYAHTDTPGQRQAGFGEPLRW